jgi:hypothetical protein
LVRNSRRWANDEDRQVHAPARCEHRHDACFARPGWHVDEARAAALIRKICVNDTDGIELVRPKAER